MSTHGGSWLPGESASLPAGAEEPGDEKLLANLCAAADVGVYEFDHRHRDAIRRLRSTLEARDAEIARLQSLNEELIENAQAWRADFLALQEHCSESGVASRSRRIEELTREVEALRTKPSGRWIELPAEPTEY